MFFQFLLSQPDRVVCKIIGRGNWPAFGPVKGAGVICIRESGNMGVVRFPMLG